MNASTFHAGQELPGFEHTITGMVMRTRQWHGVNVVHSSKEEAAKHGYKSPPATGQISAAYIQRMCVDFFGEAMFNRSVLDVRFRAPVFEDDTLAVGGRITEVIPQVDGRKVVAEAWCRNGDGLEVTRARIEVVIPD
jgi:acyl dehydratase